MSTLELVREFQILGCNDEVKRGIAARVYVDLIDVVKLVKVNPIYDADLKEIYFIGTEIVDDAERNDIYLPTSSYGDLDFLQLDEIQDKLCNDDAKSIILCICDASSTIVYYRLTKGFQPMWKGNSKDDLG